MLMNGGMPLQVVLVHVGPETNHVHHMEPPAVGFKEQHDLPRHDFHVECLSILEVVVTNFLNSFAKEFGNAPFSHLIAGIIIAARFVGQFRFDVDDGCGMVVDAHVIKGKPGWAAEVIATMVSGIPHRIREDCCEGMDPPS